MQKAVFSKDKGNSDGVQKSVVDLVLLSKSDVLSRISSIPFNYLRWGNYARGGELETVGVQTLWLDFKTKKRPIIWICLKNPNGFVGPIAYGLLITYEQGLKKAVVQNNFGYGSDNSGGFNSWSSSFTVSQEGELNIISYYNSNGDTSRTNYRWKNNRFRSFEKQEKKSNEEKYLPVPLTPG